MHIPNSEAPDPPAPEAPDPPAPEAPDPPAPEVPDPPAPTDEFSLIDGLAARFAGAGGGAVDPGDIGIGDDAALVTLPGGSRLIMATDLVVAGVHVDLTHSSPEDVGWKALMVTVSDLAAMGTDPAYALLSVVAPVGFPVERLGEGVAEAAGVAGCRVVGGDLSGGSVLVVSVTAVGPAPDDVVPVLRRSGASAGDVVLVTGPLGASAAGLRLLRSEEERRPEPASAELVEAHRRPVARLAQGRLARLAGASAAIDVSDGLVADVVHLAEASGVGLDLAVGDDAVAHGATRDEALTGGEDYELVMTTSDPDGLMEAFDRNGLRRPVVIGTCTPPGHGFTLDGGPLPVGGWRHRF